MVEKCDKCGCDINELLLKMLARRVHMIDDKPVCDDCYYDELGGFIEQNPIGAPHNKISPDKRHQP